MKNKNLQLDGESEKWIKEQVLKNPMEYYAFIDGLFQPRFSVGQIGISSQELQYWRKNQLVNIQESNDSGRWTKVSFFDYCWLKLIAEMRKLYVPIEHIKKVKEVLFYVDEEALYIQMKTAFQALKDEGELTDDLLEISDALEKTAGVYKERMKRLLSNFILLLIDLIRRNSPASLIIDKKGICSIILLNECLPTERLSILVTLFDESFTAIRLNNILDEFYENPRIKETHIKDLFRLTDKEMKVLAILRKEGIKEVRVRFGNEGKGIVLVEVVEEKNINSVKEKLKAIIDKEKVQNIRISHFEGNLLLFEETTKIKL